MKSPVAVCGAACVLCALSLSAAFADTQITGRECDSGWTRISYVLRPTTSSYIRCELALPDPSKWDGRLWGHGNGGWAGRVLCLRGMDGDQSAHVQCDAGTSMWQIGGQRAPQEVVDDFFWRATHLMTVEAKRLVREFYGREAHHAYFTGASTGGRQALFEAYLFPDDYDGIVSEVPYFNWLDAAAYAWRVQRLKKKHGMWFTAEEQQLIRDAELAWFASGDPEWAHGRFIVDPRPTPERLDGCWQAVVSRTPALSAKEKIWRALFEPVVVGGRQLACGAAIGMEFSSHWPFLYERCIGKIALDQVNEKTLLDLADRMMFDRSNPDLSGFRRRGGKLLMYAGYEDASVPAPPVSSFYDSLARNMGGVEKVREFFRYYVVPGRSHGALGAAFGKGQVGQSPDLMSKLVRWVEQGETPQSLEFTFVARGSRLSVAPYPTVDVRLAPESADERRERTESRPLDPPQGPVLAGVTFNGQTPEATGGRIGARAVWRETEWSGWKIASCEIPVPGEPAKAFQLTVTNVGNAPADLVLGLTDPGRTAWLDCSAKGENTSSLVVKAVRPGQSRTFFGGRITSDSSHARWYLAKFTEDGDGIFARSQWAPLPR